MKRNLLYLSLSLILGGAALSSCSSDPEVEPIQEPQITENPTEEPETPIELKERKPIMLSASQTKVANGLQDFNIAFTMDACGASDAKYGKASNVVCSPLGAEMLFSMTLNGLEEKDRTEMMNYLGVSDLETLNSLNAILLENLPQADNSSKFNLANAMWVNSGLLSGLNPDYSFVFTGTYSGIINFGNFSTENNEVISAINKWGSEHTNGMIPKYLNSLTPDALAVILNGLYFGGTWRNEIFSKLPTTMEVFHSVNGDSKVEMMHTSKMTMNVCEDEDFYLISLPYGNKAFSMTVLIPKANSTNVDLSQSITSERIENLKRRAVEYSVQLNMPKFTHDDKFDVSEILSHAGIKSWDKFLNLTMFKETVPGALHIEQGVSIIVDEKGTEAAAITSDIPFTCSGEITKPQELTLTIDRSFYFFIQEYSTNAMIMSGRISDL